MTLACWVRSTDCAILGEEKALLPRPRSPLSWVGPIPISLGLLDRGEGILSARITFCKVIFWSHWKNRISVVRQDLFHTLLSISSPTMEEQDYSWEKPAWAKNGPGLRKTGANAATGKLEKPITSLPHQKDDGPFAKPEWTADVDTIEKPEGNLAKPITSATSDPTKWEKPDWTKKQTLKGTGKGDKLRSGNDIARPIGGIKAVDDE